MDNYDIIVLGGQSNAEGYGVGTATEEWIPDNNGVVIPKVLTHSNDGHLYREGLSTKYNGKWEF